MVRFMEKRVLPNKVLLEEVAALVAQGKDVVFTPKGNSMLPFIRGDRDSVRLSACGEPEKGDIILANGSSAATSWARSRPSSAKTDGRSSRGKGASGGSSNR